MTFDLARYTEELLNDADNLSPEQREALKAALTSSKAGERLKRDVMARSDYSSSKDALDAERERLRQWHESEQAKIDQANAILARARETGRDSDGRYASPDSIARLEETVATLQKQLNERVEGAISINLGLSEDIHIISDRYRELFGKSAPLSEIREHALKSGLSLRQGFEDYIRPELEKKREAEWAAKEKEIYEKGVNDGMSRATNPTTLQTIRLNDHPLLASRDHIKLNDKPFSELSKDEQDAASERAFEESYNKSNGFRNRQAFGS